MEARLHEFYDSFERRDYSHLENLSNDAGYRDRFDVLSTNVMTRTDNGRLTYWNSTGLIVNLINPLVGDDAKLKIKNYMIKTLPRENWKARYTDLFTRVKEGEDGLEFVDCWQINQSGRIGLSKGKFLKHPNKDLDDETSRVLFLSEVRERYPPPTAWDLIVGSNPAVFAVKRFLDFGIGLGLYSQTGNPYIALTGVGLFELGFYMCMNDIVGSPFKKLGVELDKSAIKSLVEEA